MAAFVLNLEPVIDLSDEQFYQLCQANRDVRFERTAKGELVVMPPTGGETGRRSSDIFGELWTWNRQQTLGIVFDSSTAFHLPDGADRSPFGRGSVRLSSPSKPRQRPDAAWVKSER